VIFPRDFAMFPVYTGPHGTHAFFRLVFMLANGSPAGQ
jgi:hypothetical protein